MLLLPRVLTNYLKEGKEEKLKYQSIDSSFIANKGGSIEPNNKFLSDQVKKKNKEIKKNNKKLPKKDQKRTESFIDQNKFNGRKKYFKVSSIVDSKGAPLVSKLISSRQSDSISVIETVEKLPSNLNTLKNSKNNRYKQYILADALYNTNKNKSYARKMGYTPIFAYNKRNTKDKEKIKMNRLKGKKLKIYKKRNIIEAFFSWIKNFPVINQNYQKTLESYNGLLSLASSIIISNKM